MKRAPSRDGGLRPPLRAAALALPFLLLVAPAAHALPGLLAGKGATRPVRREAHAVIVRDGLRTALTLASDYDGPAGDLAFVVPVPAPLERKNLNVADANLVEALDRFTAPRLVEAADPSPCAVPQTTGPSPSDAPPEAAAPARRPFAYGIVTDRRYEVGDFTVDALTAAESKQIASWLTKHGYSVPKGAAPALAALAKQGWAFVVARVAVPAGTPPRFLKPLQIAYESDKLVLPLRLGTANAPSGRQALHLTVLTRAGRAELNGIKTARVPAGDALPPYLRHDPRRFYDALLARQISAEKGAVALLEFAGDVAWCEPCAGEPLGPDALRKLGVFWVDRNAAAPKNALRGAGAKRRPATAVAGTPDAYATRYYLSYDAKSAPQSVDVVVTEDRSELVARYQLRQPWRREDGEAGCNAADAYGKELAARQEQEARALARLTGWDLVKIRREMGAQTPQGEGKAWVDDVWK